MKLAHQIALPSVSNHIHLRFWCVQYFLSYGLKFGPPHNSENLSRWNEFCVNLLFAWNIPLRLLITKINLSLEIELPRAVFCQCRYRPVHSDAMRIGEAHQNPPRWPSCRDQRPPISVTLHCDSMRSKESAVGRRARVTRDERVTRVTMKALRRS